MKRKSSEKKGVDVYSFNEDDAKVEHESKTNMKKYQNSFTNFNDKIKKASKDTSPITKYTFLQAFSRESKYAQVGTSEPSIVEVDSSHSGHKGRRKSNSGDKQEIKSLNARATLREDSFTKERISGPDGILVPDTSGSGQIVLSSSDSDESGNVFHEGSSASSCQVKDFSLGVPSAGKNDSVEVMSDDEICIKQSPPQIRSSVIGENEGYLEDSSSDHNSSESDRENINMEVTVSPDLLKYEDKHGKRTCSESLLTFSHSCIKLECTNSYGKRESFSSEWAVSQVFSIESQWFLPVQTALVKICIRPITEKDVEDVNDDPGLLELQFAVFDTCWLEKHERICSLDARYRALWKLVLDNDTWEVGFSGESSSSSSKHYSPNIDEHFEGVIYPQSDPDAVIITKRDIELLQPMRFLNDTIIDFYIKYLKNKIPPEDGHRFHFFNSFFFRKLADLDQDLPSAYQGREAFQRVRKWTRKVNLFEKDYIFIPINFHHHWSLIIICHPGEVAKSKGEDVENPVKVPCILHMNSIEGSHRGIMKVIQSYLWEEWNERTEGASEDYLSKFHNLRFVNLEVPQQENSYDCGLFLLHYVECFLQEAPVNFSLFDIAKDSTFLNVNWFVPAEASRKRSVICDLINELAENRGSGHAATTNNEQHDLPVGNTENDFGQESGIPLVSETGTSGRTIHADSSFSIAGLRIENEPRVSNAGSFTQAEYRTDSFQQLNGIVSLLQENAKNDEQFANAPPGEIDSQPFEVALYDEVEVSVEQGEDENEGYDVEASSLGSHDEIESGTDLHHLPTNNSKEQEVTEKRRSVSPEDGRCIVGNPASASSHERPEDLIAEDSQEVNTMMVENVRCMVGSPAHERLEDRIVEDSQEVNMVMGENVMCIVGSPAHERLEDRIVEDSQEVDMVMADGVLV
ncbi:hypothetical protein MKW98_025606 [Papaver atlanticum]|uniref:Ubiquitin-like protease family profile domain-containing protein n=1 Tax=Papaver atlanticum TaxID=357466 RepID=A0AAD4XC22_9MAGN|nr:hypothetical protein MKW98_025606 [Papaver atlanticum]